MSESAIWARGLTKVFANGLVALKAANLVVEEGSVYGLIGRNASGKTTLLRIFMGLISPNEGEACVLGSDLRKAPRHVRAQVAYVPQTERLPAGMTLEELGRYLKHVNERWDMDLARGLAKRWGVSWNRAVGCLSHGERRRAALVAAYASRPRVLILDEPSAGFDPIARRELAEQLLEALAQQERCTVLLSTHLIGDLERLADHVGILDRGRVAFSGRLDRLLSEMQRVQVIFDEDDVPKEFGIPGAIRMTRCGPVAQAIVRWQGGQELEGLRGTVPGRVQVFPIGLEELFIELFGDRSGLDGEAGSPQQTPYALDL